MGRTHLVIPDCHAHPDHSNERADYLSELIADIRPDVVINLGDMFDMPSLSGYDKGKKSFWGKAYSKDIAAGREFDERMWAKPRRLKKKLPLRVFIEGNHEERLRRLLEVQPELEGTVGFEDFDLRRNYDIIVPYNGQTPGTIKIDGVNYCHYAVSGVKGFAIGGVHPAYSLLTKKFESITTGHTHILDYCARTRLDGSWVHGLVAGVYQDYTPSYAGETANMWWRGVVIKRNVENGNYDPEFVSLDRLRKEYG